VPPQIFGPNFVADEKSQVRQLVGQNVLTSSSSGLKRKRSKLSEKREIMKTDQHYYVPRRSRIRKPGIK